VEAGEQLGASLDFEETFRQLASTVVPGFADWCVINLVRRDQRLHRVAIVHRDKARQAMADELVGNPLLRSSSVIRDLGAGRSLVFERVDEEQLRAFFKDVPHGEQIVALGWGSCIITPLVARGVTLGAITFVRLPGSPPYDGRTSMSAPSLPAVQPSRSTTRASTASPNVSGRSSRPPTR
jgi:hypothetical protein